MTRVGVVSFPGSNCEYDVAQACARLGAEASILWHGAHALGDLDAVVLPGGFAHGDYLRPGAIARFSPIMEPVRAFAEAGGAVLGICNGFQVLTEAGLLPGALRPNAQMRFLCEDVELAVTSTSSVLTDGLVAGQRLRLPINHYEGNYTCDDALAERLFASGQVVLTYCDNPNGSVGAIAGVANEAGNVVGLMPHPERACDALLGGEDGKLLLGAFLVSAVRAVAR